MRKPNRPSPARAFRRPLRGVSPAPAAILAMCALISSCALADDDAVLVLAAASTIDAVEAAIVEFNGENTRIEVSFAATSILARQVEEGAPADIMLSASRAWADYVQERATVDRRTVLVSNQLAVIVPSGSDLRSGSLSLIGESDRIDRIAIADPASVPAGIYASEALRNAGLWSIVEARLVPTLDARAALTLVAEGEVSAGLVYVTDAEATTRIRILAPVDPQLHQPIEYPVLLLGNAHAEAERFFEYLISERGRAHFYDRGFRRAVH